MDKKILSGLDPQEYEHHFDRETRDLLEDTAGLDMIITQISKIAIERILKIKYTGSYLKVNSKNFPTLYSVLEEACNILAISKIPDLYVIWSYDVNAMTAGIENPILVVNSGCIDLLSPEELLFVIGHELGHIKSQHVLYTQIISLMPLFTRVLGNLTLGIGSTVATGLEIALLNWQRMAELTADRAGLLVCQDINTATTALIKMAGLPLKYFNSAMVEDFIAQAKEFETYEYDTLDLVAKVVSIMGRTHPWTVMRAAELFKWVESGDYQNILDNSGWNAKSLPWKSQHSWKPSSMLNS